MQNTEQENNETYMSYDERITKIITIANKIPNIKFILPTKDKRLTKVKNKYYDLVNKEFKKYKHEHNTSKPYMSYTKQTLKNAMHELRITLTRMFSRIKTTKK